MSHLDYKESFEDLKGRVFEGISTHFPVDGRFQTLELEKLEVDDSSLQADDIRAQKQAKMEGTSWSAPVFGTLALKDKTTGKVLQRKKLKMADLPLVTRRYSHIVDGQEYQVTNQWQLKPGAYTRRRQSGELETRFNIPNKQSFDITLDPEKKTFMMERGKSKAIPVYPIMKALGVSDGELEKQWGRDILDANKSTRGAETALAKFFKADRKKAPATPEEAHNYLVNTMAQSQLRPDSTEVTLGKGFSSVNGDALALATSKMLAVQQGKLPEDDRDSLVFKDLRGAGDFAYDKLTSYQTSQSIKNKMLRKINMARTIRDVVKFDTFNEPVRQTFSKNSASEVAPQVNPVEMVASSMKTTIMGPGGIQSAQAVMDEAKLINPSHLGYLDPIHTPECMTPDAEVFTSEGWKRWDAVALDTEFACRIDGRLEFHRAEHIHKGPYKGLLYGVRNGKLDYLVTPNHRVYARPADPSCTRWRIERADEVHGKPRTFCASHSAYEGSNQSESFQLTWVAGNNSSVHVDKVCMTDWCELVGWVLSEGTITFDEEKSAYFVRIAQSYSANPENCERIEALLRRLPWSWCQDAEKRSYAIGVKELAGQFRDQGYCNTKYIPPELFHVSVRAREALLEALLFGDGRIDSCRVTGVSYKQRVYGTTSQQLALDFERLALGLGYSVRMKVYEDNREERYLDVYEVRILRHVERTAWPKKGHYYTKQYDGLVYCATVPGSLLLVRRNDSVPIWTGNSEKTGVTLHLPLAVKKVGREARIPLYNVRTGKMEHVGPQTFMTANVVMPDQVSWDSGKPKPVGTTVKMAVIGNEIHKGKFKDADYVMMHPSQMFSVTSNLIPFMGNNSGNRASYATHHLEQAISLKDREPPLVQVGTGAKKGGLATFEEFLGKNTGHIAPVAGKVSRVEKDAIFIKGADGKEQEVQIYDNFPLNDMKSVLHSEPTVKPGDRVTVGQSIADTNYTKGGKLALGTNLDVAYIPYKGYNFEDGVVISESAAKKLSSVHMHKPVMKLDQSTVTDPKKFMIQHTEAFTRDQYGLLGSDGVVKVGTKVQTGDPLILGTKPYELKDRTGVGAIRKSASGAHTDVSLRWESDHPGEVVGVHKNKKGEVTIHVRTVEPMQVGDKLTGRHGNKGIVTKILADVEMPKTKAGKHIEVALNPAGIPGRMNVGQVLETAAGKIARKVGQPYIVENFARVDDQLEKVKNDLKKHGLSDTEELIDPKTGQSLGHALTGPQHMLKLTHQIDKKLSVRSGMNISGAPPESYDHNLIPSGGGKSGGQSMGNLGMYVMLAHGAKANIREMQTWKSEGPDSAPEGKQWRSQHDDVWRAIQNGDPLPPPKSTFAFQKFTDMLRVTGVNVEKQGNRMRLTPLTDAQVLAMSNGEVQKPSALTYPTIDKKTGEPKPIRGGLFDEKVTGGHGGKKWSHFKLAEPMPNPVFEGAIQKVLGLTQKDYSALIEGGKAVDQKSGKLVPLDTPGSIAGGPAVVHLLGNLDVASELKKAQAELDQIKVDPAKLVQGANTQKLDKAFKRVKYLQTLQELGMKPTEAYTLQHVPVLPPAMRPASVLPDGSIKWADLNGLYKDLGALNEQLSSPAQRYLDDTTKKGNRASLYDGLKAMMGVGMSHADREGKNKGVLLQIAGATPKQGYFQKTLLSRRQDLSMRSTIVPEPAMGLDQVGLPTEKAMTLFRPFLIKKMVDVGAAPTALDAAKLLEQKGSHNNKQVQKALDLVMEERPILLKRDPALHKHSVQAFNSFRVPGKAIQIHPLVTSGYNADFDGDCVLGDLTVVLGPRSLSRMPHTGPMYQAAIVDIAEFPRIEESAVFKKSGVVEYDVPLDVYVPAYAGGRMEMKPVTLFSVHPDCEEWKVTTRNGRELTCSSNHSLALLNPETLEVEKASPRDAVGRCLPVMRSLSEPKLYQTLPGAVPLAAQAVKMVSNVPLDFDSGWFIGTSTGDGWVSDKRRNSNWTGRFKSESDSQSRGVCLAYGDGGLQVRDEWVMIGLRLANSSVAGDVSLPHMYQGHECSSHRCTISSTALGLWLEELMGKGANGKHLPAKFLEYPEAFRQGLFCGLVDTDGTVNWSKGSRAKKKQFTLSFSTISKDLADGVQLLGLSLGLPSHRTTYQHNDKPAYIVVFSSRPIQDARWIRLKHTAKKAALEKFWASESIEFGRNDFVPVTDRAREELLGHLRALGAALRPPERNSRAFSQYVVLQRDDYSITRTSAEKLFELLHNMPLSTYLTKWFNIALDPTVGWDSIKSAQATGEKKTMYDITVPDSWTFTMSNGAVVWDTMSAYVPISDDAVTEARKMFPSNNLFNEATGRIAHVPTLESALGLYKLSRVTGDAKRRFKSPADALKAVEAGKLQMTQAVQIAGIGKTTPGRLMLSTALPESMQKKILTDHSFMLDKKGVEILYTDLAKNHRGDYGDAANRLKDLGFDASYGLVRVPNPNATGPDAIRAAEKAGAIKFLPMGTHTLSLDDLTPDKVTRDRVVKQTQRRVDMINASQLPKAAKDQRAVEEWTKATNQISAAHMVKAVKKDDNLFQMLVAGTKPKMNQYQQIKLSPMLVEDAAGRTLPTPVTKSYAEGLDVSGYWTQMSGARKGSVKKVQEVRDPGYFSKRLISTTMNLLVNGDDCGTQRGVGMNVMSNDIYDRRLATDVTARGRMFKAGTILTPDVVSQIRAADKNAQVVVRSSLKCEHGAGLCQKCAGLAPGGKPYELGTNLGILSAQSLGERSVQLSLKEFHSGGVAGAGGTTLGMFGRIKQLTEMPKKIPDAAKLAMTSGVVDKVETGKLGTTITISGRPHFVPLDRAGRLLTQPLPDAAKLKGVAWTPPQVGQKIQRGTLLSDPNRTFVNMHDLYRATGSMEKVQNHLVNELHGLYKEEGVRREHIETVVKGMSNLTRVYDPGNAQGILKGEFQPTSVVAAQNRQLVAAGKKPIQHTPILKGVDVMPLTVQEDWMAKLNFERLRGSIVDGAATGAYSNLHGEHPIPGMAFGARFGMTSKDKRLDPSLAKVPRWAY